MVIAMDMLMVTLEPKEMGIATVMAMADSV